MKKLNWHKANGEILGFAICVPILVALTIGIIAISAHATRSQQLTISTYAAGRAAAVSQTKELGENRARAVLQNIYRTQNFGETSVWFQFTTTNNEWNAGDLFTIEVHQAMPALYPFQDRDQSCSLTMLIEGGV